MSRQCIISTNIFCCCCRQFCHHYSYQLPTFQSALRMLCLTATGGTVVNVLDDIISRGADASKITIVCVVACPPALKKLSEKFPGTTVNMASWLHCIAWHHDALHCVPSHSVALHCMRHCRPAYVRTCHWCYIMKVSIHAHCMQSLHIACSPYRKPLSPQSLGIDASVSFLPCCFQVPWL